jgi:hypothetical protein
MKSFYVNHTIQQLQILHQNVRDFARSSPHLQRHPPKKDPEKVSEFFAKYRGRGYVYGVQQLTPAGGDSICDPVKTNL